VEDELSEKLLRGEFQSGDTVVVDVEDDHIVFRTVSLAEPLPDRS
jgi:ATP-dependent Clp protease ATP-binding subunit ClpA